MIPHAEASPATAPTGSPLLVGRRFESVLAAAGVAFVVAGTRASGQALVVLVVGFGALLLLAGAGRPATDRRTLALGGILTLLIAIPINRLTGVTLVIVAVIAVCLALAAAALLWSPAPAPPGWLVVVGLTSVVGVVTVVSPDQAALLRFAPYLASFVPVYLMFGQATATEQRRVLGVILLAAVLEGTLATAEPFIGSPQLWAPAQLDSDGNPATLMNPLLPSLARSQGTLGHPLPLGILLAAALAILVRGVRSSRVAKALVALPLVSGLALSGSRNSIVIAILVCAYFAPRSATVVRWVGTTLVLAFAALFAIATGVLNGRLAGDFEASGSVTHRSGALDAFSRLFTDQTLTAVLTGNGWASTARLFDLGLLQTDGFGAVDNELVLLFGQGGLVCLALLLVLIVRAGLGARAAYRPLLLAMVVTLFIFDLLIWPSAAALCGAVLAACVARADPWTGNGPPTAEVTSDASLGLTLLR